MVYFLRKISTLAILNILTYLAKCSEKNSNNGSVGADIVMDMSSNRCPENSEVSVEAPPVCQSETVQGAEEMNSGSRKSLTTIPDCSTQLKSSPESNQNNQKRIISNYFILD